MSYTFPNKLYRKTRRNINIQEFEEHLRNIRIDKKKNILNRACTLNLP